MYKFNRGLDWLIVINRELVFLSINSVAVVFLDVLFNEVSFSLEMQYLELLYYNVSAEMVFIVVNVL